MLRACEVLLFTRPYLCRASVCNLCGYLALWVAGILVCYIYRQQGTKVFPARGFQNPPQNAIERLERQWLSTSDHHGQPHARCGASQGDAASVLTFGLAINEKKKDTETGEYVDAPVFVDAPCSVREPKHLLPTSPRGRRFRWMDGSATTLG